MNRHRVSPSVVFGDVNYPPGGAFGPRVQQDVQLVIVYEGEARVLIENILVEVPSQHALLLLPARREQFQFARTRPTRHTWCSLKPALVGPERLAQLALLPPCLPLTERIHSLVEYGLAMPPAHLGAAEQLLQAVGMAALEAFVFEAELARGGRGVPDAVWRAQQFIEAQLGEQLRLEQIAQAANVTPQHLTRLFHQHVGMTPTYYLWRLRVRRGVELLGETGLSIGEIASRVGFQSPFHFSRLVRQHYQHSPRQLRARLWRGEPPANTGEHSATALE
jgi:AraC family transcriptional regulator of arabinose operon